MQVSLCYGRDRIVYDVPEARLVAPPWHAPARLPDLSVAVRAALESPLEFPALRRALTPDDHVTVVVDEELPCLVEMLAPILEHITSAGVIPESITLLCAPSTSRQAWIEQLPEAFEEVRLEVHNPNDRKALSYLATTRQGRRVYLNRSLVDADQTVVLSGRRYDSVLGFTGAEGSLFPAMSDEATRAEFAQHGGIDAAANSAAQAALEEATEAGWLLGVPFFVQAIEGVGDSISAIVAGSVDASVDGRRIQDQQWKRIASRPADLVVATVSGDPVQHTFPQLAAAMLNASRVVRAGGRVVLLTQAAPTLGPELTILRDADEPLEALRRLQKQPAAETVPALRWAAAASHARLTLLSQLAEESVEELFAVALQNPEQVQRLLDAGGDVLFLEDAHKSSTSLSR